MRSSAARTKLPRSTTPREDSHSFNPVHCSLLPDSDHEVCLIICHCGRAIYAPFDANRSRSRRDTMTSNARVALVTEGAQPRCRSQHGDRPCAQGRGHDRRLSQRQSRGGRCLGGHRSAGAQGGDVPARYRQGADFAPFAADLKRALAEGWSRSNFDYLVNNAGIGIHSPFAETTEADFDRLMNINLKGNILPDPDASADDRRRRPHRERLKRPRSVQPAGLRRFPWGDEGRRRSADALSRQGAGTAGASPR